MKQINNIIHIAKIFLVIIVFFITTSHLYASQPKNSEKYAAGMNLNGIADWSTEFPFLDLMKQARPWVAQSKDSKKWGAGGNLNLDDNGWIKKLQHNQYADTIFISAKQKLPYTKFTVIFDGEGLIKYSGLASLISIKKPNVHLIKVKNNVKGYAILSIRKTNPNNYIRNIKIIPTRYMDRFKQGQFFNPEWISFIKKFQVLRYMDWMKTNNSTQQKWKDRPHVTDYTWTIKGVPIEAMIELSNHLSSDPWFNIPHNADYEYIENFALLVKKRLDKNLRIYVEHSNEVWNWMFKQTHFAQSSAYTEWGEQGDHYLQWHGMKTSKICSLWKTIFGNESNRVICVLGVHPGSIYHAKSALKCESWVRDGNMPCYKNIDAIAITGYFTGCIDGHVRKNEEWKIRKVQSWLKNMNKAMEKAYKQTLEGKIFSCNRTLVSLKENYNNFRKLADQYNLHLFVYEGGQHITANGSPYQDDKNFIEFHIKFNRSEYMYKLTKANFENWKSSNGELFVYFNDITPPSKYGSWGSMDHLRDYASPKIRAINDFFSITKCWWKLCSNVGFSNNHVPSENNPPSKPPLSK